MGQAGARVGDTGPGSSTGRQESSAERQPWVRSLTGAAAPAIGDDATEVPVGGLTAVTLEAPHTRAAGALARAWVTGATIGAMRVALAHTCKATAGRGHHSGKAPPRCGQGWAQALTWAASQAHTPGSSDVILAAAEGGLGAVQGDCGWPRGHSGACGETPDSVRHPPGPGHSTSVSPSPCLHPPKANCRQGWRLDSGHGEDPRPHTRERPSTQDQDTRDIYRSSTCSPGRTAQPEPYRLGSVCPCNLACTHTRAHEDMGTQVHPHASNHICSHTCAEMSLVHL